MKPPETELLIHVNDDFLSSNAEYFVQSFVDLNEIFQSSGQMSIISQEHKFTVAVGMKVTEDIDAMDVDCVLLKPNQHSLRDCINVIAHK